MPSTSDCSPDAAPALPALHEGEVEELFFLEGIDGHAESVPSSEPAGASASVDASLDEERPAEPEVEDPARARRRRVARIGVAWGAVAMLVLAVVGVGARLRARTEAPLRFPA